MIEEFSKRRVFRVLSGYAVVCFVVLQIADVTFGPLGISDGVLRAVIAIMCVGLPVVGFLAWMFDVGPDAKVKRTSTERPRIEATVALLAVALFAGGVWWLLRPLPDGPLVDPNQVAITFATNAPTSVPSLAILPFNSRGVPRTQRFLGEALAEDLIARMNQSGAIRVISSGSAFAYRERAVPLNLMSQQLGVQYVLEGSINSDGRELRIAVSLVDAKTGLVVWSALFDQLTGRIFDIQDAIAQNVAEALQVTLEYDIQIRTNPQAYVLWLQARHLNDRGIRAADLYRAERLLNEAVNLDPRFVYGWTELARVNYRKGNFDEYSRLTQKAYQLDQNDAVVLAFLAFDRIVLHGDIAGGARYMEQATLADPSHPQVIMGLNNILPRLGLLGDLVRINEYRVARDPLCVYCMEELSQAYRQNGDVVAAQRVIERMLLVEPEPGFRLNLERTYVAIQSGDYDKALGLTRLLDAFPEDQTALRAAIYYKMGRTEDYEIEVAVLQKADSAAVALNLASVYAFVGEDDSAFKLLPEAFDRAANSMEGLQDYAGLISRLRSSGWQDYENDPRWQQLLAKYGVSKNQVNALQFNPRLP